MSDKKSSDLKLKIQAALDRVKSYANIKKDLKALEPGLKIKIKAILDKAGIRKEVNKGLRLTSRVKINADTSQADREIARLGNRESQPKITPVVDDTKARANLAETESRTKAIFNRFAKSAVGVNLIRMSVQKVIQSIGEAIAWIREMNTIKAEMKITSGASDPDADAMMSSYNRMAGQLGVTTKSVSETATELLRLGESAVSADEMIKSSQVLSRIGMIENADAVNYLVSCLRGYRMGAEEAMTVVNKLSAVDLEAAVSAGELAEAMARCSPLAVSAGTSMDRLVGYLAAVGENSEESMSVVGNAFSAIYDRMNNIKAGKLIDDKTGESLAETEEDLNKLGIRLRNSANLYKDFDNVLDEVSQKWDKYTEAQKNEISIMMAGNPQREQFLTLMNHYSAAMDYAGAASVSAGLAMERYGSYQNSIEAKSNELTAALESLSINMISEESYAGIVKAVTGLVQFLDKTNLLKDSLSGLAAMQISRIFASMGADIITAVKSTSQLTAAMALFGKGNSRENLENIGRACTGLSDQQLKLVLSTKGLDTQQRLLILSGMGVQEEQRKQKLETLGLSDAQKQAEKGAFSLRGALRAAWISNPIGVITTGIGMAVSAFSMAVSWYKRKQEEAARALDDAVSEYDSAKSSLESINSQLAEHGKRLDELKRKEKLTYAEKGELEDLKAITRELRIQQSIEQRRVRNDSREVAQKAVELFEKEYETDGISESDISEKQAYMSATGNMGAEGEKDVVSNIAAYLHWQGLLSEAQEKYHKAIEAGDDVTWIERDIQKYMELADSYGVKLDNNIDDLQEMRFMLENEYRQAIKKRDENNVAAPDDRKIIDTYESIYDMLRILYDYTNQNEWNALAIEDILNTEGIEKTEEELFAMMEAGELTAEKLAGFKNLYAAIEDSRLFLDSDTDTLEEAFIEEMKRRADAIKTINGDFQMPPPSISDTVTQFDALKEKMDVLKQSYTKLSDEGTGIGLEDFGSINEAFGEMDHIDDYILRLQEAGQNTEAVTEVTDALLSAYINYIGILDTVNEQNAALIAQGLTELGIEDAQSIVMQQLAVSRELAVQKTFALADATTQEIIALASEGAVSDAASGYILRYALQKELANGVTLTTDGDIENIKLLVEMLGGSTDALLRFQAARSGRPIEVKNPHDKKIHTGKNKTYIEGQYDDETFRKEAQEEIDDVLSRYGGRMQNSTGKAGTKETGPGRKSGTESGQKQAKQTYNWIDRLLETISEKTKLIADAFSRTFSIGSAQEKYAQYLMQIESAINADCQAIAIYQQKLDAIGLSYEWIVKIQTGALSIDDVTDENLKNQISQYQQWYTKMEACYDNVRLLEEERLKAQAEYADKVVASHDREINAIQRGIDRQAAFSDLQKSFAGFASAGRLNVQLDQTALRIDMAEKQNRALQELIRTTTYGSDAWKTYDDRIEENKKSLLDLAQNLADLARQLSNLPIEKYEAFLQKLDAKKELYDLKLDNSHSYGQQKRILDRQMELTVKGNAKAQQTADKTQKSLSAAGKGFSQAWEMDRRNAAPGQEAAIDKYYDEIRKYIKSGKVIPATIIARLSEAGHGALANAAVRYNAALTANETAQATARLMAQTTLRELAETARQKAEIPADRYNAYLDRNETKNGLYGAKLDNAISAKKQNSIIRKQMSLVSKNNARAQQTAEDTAENLSSAKDAFRGAKKRDSGGKNKKQKKKISSIYKKIQSYIKAKKEIPSSLITKLAEENYASLYQAAVNYNAALAADMTAQQTAALSAETAKKEIAELAKSKFDNIQNEYERKQSAMDSKADILSAKMDLTTAKGYLESKNWYSSLSEYEQKNNQTLSQELQKLKADFDASLKSGEIEKYSEEWWEMTDSINAVTEALAKSDVTLQEYRNSLRQAESDIFVYIQRQISRLTAESDFFIDAMAERVLKDDGGLNNYGLTAAGLHYQNYDTYLKQAEDYAAEIRRINALLAENPYDTNLMALMEQYQDAQRECIRNAQAEKKAIADLVREGYESLTESLQKAVNKYKELLQNAKNAHDYQEQIEEQADHIASLQKQLTAYSGMTGNEETAAKIQTLNKELADAQKNMQETMYDRYISDTQDALDGMLAGLETFVSELYNNLEELFREGVEAVTGNTDLINDTLVRLSGEYGITLSDAIRAAWNENYYNPENGFALILGRMDALIAASDAQSAAGTQTAQERPSPSDPASSPSEKAMFKEKEQGQGDVSGRQSKTAEGTLTSAAGQKKRAEEFIRANVKKPEKAYEKYSDVNRVIWDNKAEIYPGSGKTLRLEDMKKLAGILGISYNNAGRNGNLYKKLKAVGVKGFASGGIGEVVKTSGEDGLALVRNKEGFVKPEDVEYIKKLMNVIPDMEKFVKVATPDYSRFVTSDIRQSVGDVHLNLGGITMNGVNDPQTFGRQLREEICRSNGKTANCISEVVATKLLYGPDTSGVGGARRYLH